MQKKLLYLSLALNVALAALAVIAPAVAQQSPSFEYRIGEPKKVAPYEYHWVSVSIFNDDSRINDAAEQGWEPIEAVQMGGETKVLLRRVRKP